MILEHGPSHTKDISQAKADLDKFGYCVIPEVLNDTEIEISKKRLLEQAEAEEELGLSFRDGGANQEVKVKNGRLDKDSFSIENGGINQRLWMLANKGECFRDMVTHPLVDELVGHMLGVDFISVSYTHLTLPTNREV